MGLNSTAQLDRYRRLDSLETVLRFDNLYKYKDPRRIRGKRFTGTSTDLGQTS
jgi:hypothetical protein